MQSTSSCLLGTVFLSAVIVSATFSPAQNLHASVVTAHDDKGQAGGGIFNTQNLLGPIDGQVHSLGNGGHATVGFDQNIVNGPGADLIITENSFFSGGAAQTFAEMAFVEVSSDGKTFARIPTFYRGPASFPGAYGVIHIGSYGGMAGATPRNVQATDPADVVDAGGDAIDLDDLANDPLVKSGAVDLQAISHLRLVDVQSGIDTDSQGTTIYDPGNGSSDIDGITLIHHDLNRSSHKPEVDVRIPKDGRLEIIVRDPDGIGDLDPQSLRLALFGKEIPFVTLLPFMQVLSINPLGFHLRLSTTLPQGFLLRVSVSVKDRAGHRSGDTRSR